MRGSSATFSSSTFSSIVQRKTSMSEAKTFFDFHTRGYWWITLKTSAEIDEVAWHFSAAMNDLQLERTCSSNLSDEWSRQQSMLSCNKVALGSAWETFALQIINKRWVFEHENPHVKRRVKGWTNIWFKWQPCVASSHKDLDASSNDDIFRTEPIRFARVKAMPLRRSLLRRRQHTICVAPYAAHIHKGFSKND